MSGTDAWPTWHAHVILPEAVRSCQDCKVSDRMHDNHIVQRLQPTASKRLSSSASTKRPEWILTATLRPLEAIRKAKAAPMRQRYSGFPCGST